MLCDWCVNNTISTIFFRKSFSYIKDDDTFGGVFGVTKGLAKKYSRDRVIDTPIAEHIHQKRHQMYRHL
jgi:hypothetical protein